MKNIRLWAALLILFLSGAAVGASGTWIFWQHRALGYFSGRGGNMERAVLGRLDRALDLSALQKERIEGILCRTHDELTALRARYRPERERIMEQSAASIREELSPGQQEKFDAILEKIKARRAKREAFPRAGGGPLSRACQ